MIYTLIVKIVNGKTYSKAEITKRVNVFFLNGQITEEEYQEILQLIENKYN